LWAANLTAGKELGKEIKKKEDKEDKRHEWKAGMHING